MKWTFTLGELVIFGSLIAFAVTANLRLEAVATEMRERPTWTQLEAATGVKRDRWDEASDMIRAYRASKR